MDDGANERLLVPYCGPPLQRGFETASIIRRNTDGADRRCCTNRNWPARCQPTGPSPADAIRRWPAKVGHPIQDLATEDGLTPLPGWTPGSKAISDDRLVSEERVLYPGLTMVPDAFFERRRPSLFTDLIVRSRAADRGPWRDTFAVLTGGTTTVAPRTLAVS